MNEFILKDISPKTSEDRLAQFITSKGIEIQRLSINRSQGTAQLVTKKSYNDLHDVIAILGMDELSEEDKLVLSR